jgi:hypothetical protein
VDGTANTGSGGGGSHSVTSGAGGDGTVFLRMLTANYSGVETNGETPTTDGDYTIIQWKSTGSYTA